MLGRKERDQLELYMCGSLRDLVPDDHVLVKVDGVLDLSWLHEEVAELYAAGFGRPGIDPEVAVRLMLAGFLLGIVHDRRLMREAQVNIAIRWFIGFGLHEALPDHSSLTRIRQRWGAERFRTIFERTVKVCVAAKVAKGEVARRRSARRHMMSEFVGSVRLRVGSSGDDHAIETHYDFIRGHGFAS
jgi:transposase